MLVLRIITAAYVPTGQAQPQVNPGITHFQALQATLTARSDFLDGIQVRAFGISNLGHNYSFLRNYNF
jgi:hypothetical protein